MPARGQIDPSIRDEAGKIIPWRRRHRDASNRAERARRALHPDKIRAENRQYRERNPYNVAVHVAHARAKKLSVPSTLTANEWKNVVEGCDFRCHLCGGRVSFEICSPLRLSLDHVIPMSRGGANSRENVLPAHRRCNQSRLDMTLDEFRTWLRKISGYQKGEVNMADRAKNPSLYRALHHL